MLTIFSFKLALLQILPYLYYTQHKREIEYLTSSYSEIEAVTQIHSATVELPYWSTDIRIVHNGTSRFLLIDLPESIPLCTILGYYTKLLPCATPYTVSTAVFRQHLQYDLIKGIFSLTTFDIGSEDDFLALLLSNNYDETYIIQSFPSTTVNLTQPLYAEDICKTENGCRLEADWASFVGLSVRDVAITYGVHYGLPVALRTMVNSWRAARGGLSVSGLGLWGRAQLLATTPIFPDTISAASSVYELAPMAAHPVSAVSGIVSQTSQQSQRVIHGMRAYSSMPNIAVSGAEVAASNAGSHALEALSTSSRIATRTTWVTRMVRALSSLRFRRTVLRSPTTNTTITQNCATLQAGRACVPLSDIHVQRDVTTGNLKYRRKRGLWSATTKIITAIPCWVTPTILSGVIVTTHGIDNLKTVDLKVKAFYPIVSLTVLEKFYATSASLIFNRCFENATLRRLLIESSPVYNTTILNFSGREYKPIDVVFNLREMRAGPILHACTPMFKLPFTGLSRQTLIRSLSLLFSPELIVDDIMYYNGLPQYVRPDTAAYINDIIPRFQPLITETHIQSNIDDYRFKRKTRRAAVVTPAAEYGNIVMGAEPSYTNAVYNMISHPNARNSFDIMTGYTRVRF